MKLYHGSNCVIKVPDIEHSRKNLDFGEGFYLTSHKKQAEKWALRKASLEKGTAIVNVFDLNDDLSKIRVKEFLENDEAWVEFVCECRRGIRSIDVDLIIGGVADDKVFEAVNMYFKGYWDMPTTLSALKFYERNDQFCFVTQEAIDSVLAFKSSYLVDE